MPPRACASLRVMSMQSKPLFGMPDDILSKGSTLRYNAKSQIEVLGPFMSIKTALLLAWTLLPCAAMWVGLYELKSAAWTYALYHGICLIPAIIWRQPLWRPTLKMPTVRDFVLIAVGSVVFSVGTVFLYEWLGKLFLSNDQVLSLLQEQGLKQNVLWAFGLYAITINPLLEEIFWRGIVFNELEKTNLPKQFGLVWSSAAYALFHYFIFRMVLFPGWAEVGTLLLAVYGALLALLYRKSGSILTTALAHALFTDMAVVALTFDFASHYPIL